MANDDNFFISAYSADDESDGKNPAADLIRQKINDLYKSEPDAVEESVESVQEPSKSRSKHQQFMYELSTSGKPLAEIQTAWHNYYLALDDSEKHAVWQEFYAANKQSSAYFKTQSPEAVLPAAPSVEAPPTTAISADQRANSVADIKNQLLSKFKSRGKLSKKQHLQSVAFGLGMGSLVILILLFGLFNERFIAPFITPSRNVSATPLILDPNNTAVGPESKIIIPKINVEVPVVYDVKDIQEESVQKGLERGVVHYATTANPGEQGNAVIFGHSSNNILNRGQYKFAFVLLSRLEKDDIFYIQKDGTRYVYKIFEKRVVKPNDLSVLESVPGKTAVTTLITCDPPGTTVNRLIVMGEQITPDPGANTASTALQTDEKPEILAGNAESLWHRITNWLF
jgi:sortase A